MGNSRPYLVSVRIFLAFISLAMIIGKFLNPDATPFYLLTSEAGRDVQDKMPYATNPGFARAILVLFAIVSLYMMVGTLVAWYFEKRNFGRALPVASPLMLVALFTLSFGCLYYAIVGALIGVYWLFAATLSIIGGVLFAFEYTQWVSKR